MDADRVLVHNLDCPPRYASPDRFASSYGPKVRGFCERFLRATNSSHYAKRGDPLVLLPWQQEVTDALYEHTDSGNLRYRRGLISLPKRQGKSILLAAHSIYDLLFSDHGSQLFVVAASRDQARLIFGQAKDFVSLSAELDEMFEVRRDSIYCPSTHNVLRVVASDADTLDGITVTKAYADEIHRWKNLELWAVLTNSLGTVPNSQLIAISTAGASRGHLIHDLYNHGRKVSSGEIEDDSFIFRCWEATEEADHTEPDTWRSCNPALGYTLHEDSFAADLGTQPESVFRRLRLNQWVNALDGWPVARAWDDLADQSKLITATDPVILAFDPSRSGDSTALVTIRIEDLHIEVVECWERQPTDPPEWRVPADDVIETLRSALGEHTVVEFVLDPGYAEPYFSLLQAEGWPVIRFPNTVDRMIPAIGAFEEKVFNRELTHSGDPRLARHIDNCRIKQKPTKGGYVLWKDPHAPDQKIDLAIASIMGVSRAIYHQQVLAKPTPKPRVLILD